MISLFVLLAVLASPAPAPSAGPAMPQPVPTPSASASPSAAAPASGAPASGAPSAAPSAPAAPLPTPAPQPTFGYHFVPRAEPSPDATAPQILEVDLNSPRLRDTIAIRVVTNDIVTRVENHTNGRADQIPQTKPGEFIAVSKLPKIPFIARGMRIDLEFVAYAADGRNTSVKVPVRLG